MKDETLERVWKTRKSIAKKCGFDSHKLVKYFQKRTKERHVEPVTTRDDKTFSNDPFYKIAGLASKDRKGALSNEEIDRIVYS